MERADRIGENKMTMLDADLSRLEAILASQVEGAPLDQHALEASKLFNVPLDKVTAEQRLTAKSRNFAKLYGVNFDG